MNLSEIKAGDRLLMTDLRIRKTIPVLVIHAPSEGKVLVAKDDNREFRYKVDAGFLSPQT